MHKSRKLRGSNTHGRGARKHKNGSKGGVGNAGSFTHHICQKQILKIKKSRYTPFSELIYKFDIFIKKEYILENKTEKNTFLILLKNFDKIINFNEKLYLEFGKKFEFKGSKTKISKSMNNFKIYE